MRTCGPVSPRMAQRIELWPLDRLIPYARNARTHSEEQVAQIAASIAEFGFNAPILVDSNAGIVAGHGRLLAARKLGLPEVPVVVLDHNFLSAAQLSRFPIWLLRILTMLRIHNGTVRPLRRVNCLLTNE